MVATGTNASATVATGVNNRRGKTINKRYHLLVLLSKYLCLLSRELTVFGNYDEKVHYSNKLK